MLKSECSSSDLETEAKEDSEDWSTTEDEDDNDWEDSRSLPTVSTGRSRAFSGSETRSELSSKFIQTHQLGLELRELLARNKSKYKFRSEDEPLQLTFQSSLVSRQKGIRIVENKQNPTPAPSPPFSEQLEEEGLIGTKYEVGNGADACQEPFEITPDFVLDGLFGVASEDLRNFLRLPQEALMKTLFEYWEHLNAKYQEESSEYESLSEHSDDDQLCPRPAESPTPPPPHLISQRHHSNPNPTHRQRSRFPLQQIALNGLSSEECVADELQSILIQVPSDNNVTVSYGQRFGILGSTCRWSYNWMRKSRTVLCTQTTPIFSRLFHLFERKDNAHLPSAQPLNDNDLV